MTVASINSTVTVVVSSELGMSAASSYSEAIAKVSEALEAREYDIVDAIAEVANERYGVSKREVATILHEAGLAERPAPVVVPEPVVEDEDEAVTADDVAAGKKSKAARIAALEESQAQIISTQAKIVEALEGLTALANRHLGSSL